jgi:hypothetical protein
MLTSGIIASSMTRICSVPQSPALSQAVIDSTAKNCTGTPEGHWAESLAKNHARIVAPSLIGTISGLCPLAVAERTNGVSSAALALGLAGSAPKSCGTHYQIPGGN